MNGIEYSIARMKSQLERAAKRRKLTTREQEILQEVSRLVEHYAARDAKAAPRAASASSEQL
jgi:hypothetical protein